MSSSTYFVHTDEGQINLAHVARIKTTWLSGGKERRVFYGADGERLGASEDQDFDPETLTAPIVPAAPGATVVLIYRPHIESIRPEVGDVWAEEVPVLAWRCLSFGAFPVTFDDEGLQRIRILHPLPDGRLLAPGDQTFETIEQAVASTFKEAQEGWDRRHPKQAAGGTP